MKHVFLLGAALSLALTPITAAAQTSGFGGGEYIKDLPDRGGRLGIVYDTNAYNRDGVQFVKVLSVESRSPYFDLAAGDFIYAVNGQRFASPEEFRRLVTSRPPGAPLTLGYLDASRAMAAYQQTANLLGPASADNQRLDQAWIDRAIAAGRSSAPPAPPPTPRPSPQHNMQSELNRSLDSIVTADSTGWWSNKYLPGSMHDSYIRSSSADGATYLARGYFSYRGGGDGWVEAKLANGSLACIQYWDTWFGCRSPYGGNHTAAQDAAIGVGVVALLAIVASAAGGSSGENDASSYDPTEGGGRRQSPPEDPYANQPVDKSVGCIWGDRRYETCPN